MKEFISKYKEQYHVGVNFFSVFLLITFIPDFLGLPSSAIMLPFWLFKIILAVAVITSFHKRIYTLSLGELLFVLLALIYAINLAIDIFLEVDNRGFGNVMDLLSFIVTVIVAMSFRYDPLFASDKSYYFFTFSLAAGLLAAFFLARPSPPPLIGRFDANSTVNTINYGQMGCAMCLTAVYGFFEKRFNYSKIIFILCFILGILSIMKAGSRAPIVVLTVVGLFYAFARLGFFKAFFLSVILGLVVYSSLDTIEKIGQSFDSGLANRVVSAVKDKETSGRDAIYANALEHIKEHPVFGSFYLLKEGKGDGGYPHNFILEVFLTTGLVGGIPFLIIVFIAIKKSYVYMQKKHDSSWLIMMYLQILVFGMFSTALYSSQDYWSLCLFVLSLTPVKSLSVRKRLKLYQRLRRISSQQATIETSNR
ncbi:MAG: O-antigen ligase family protein [Leeuwenhoekiella sp.]